MQKYTLTYQDWVNDNLGVRYVPLVCRHFKPDDYEKVKAEQNEAFLHGLNTAFETLKQDFKSEYAGKLLKQDYLDSYIETLEASLDTTRTEFSAFRSKGLHESMDGRYELTKAEVDLFLNSKVGDTLMMKLIGSIKHGHLPIGYLSEEEETRGPFLYILRANFHKWLLWFKDQEVKANTEPVLRFSESNTYEANLIDAEKAGRQSKGQVSYTWLGKSDELPELYQRLIDKQLIEPDTTVEQFQAVFTGQPLHIIQPIKWHDGNASELLYFILQLESTNNIKAGKRADYKRLQACFRKPDGNLFIEAFKSLKTYINIELSEQKQQTIRDIINNF